MKKRLVKLMPLLLMPLTLAGCGEEEAEIIVNDGESTVITNATNTDVYLEKKDYNSIAYAYIYHIKESIPTYVTETDGTVKAKVAFIDYNIEYHTVNYKKGTAFFSKEDSTSALMNLHNEFYMADKTKVLVSKDLKKYDVYTAEDYHKISYTPDQYTVMGYIFNDKTILKTEVLADKGDVITIKYTLDNDLATPLVKVDFKNNGSLSEYPTFYNVDITLSMKRDFTPVSYVIDSVYDASKPVIGSARTTQHGACTFTKVNESINIPNESFMAQQLGTTPKEVIIDNGQALRNDLMKALEKLDFAHGVGAQGALSLNVPLIAEEPIKLYIDANLLFDLKKVTEDKLYQILDVYAKVQGDSTFNAIISLIKSFAGDKLGEFASVLDNFKSLEIIYDEAGVFYLMPVNQNDEQLTMLKVKLTDILNLILKEINVYNLISGSNGEFATLTKVEEKDKDNYAVDILVNDSIVAPLQEKLNTLLASPDLSLLKTAIGYKDFSSIKARVTVVNGAVSAFNGSFNYVKDDDAGTVASLIDLHLEATNKTFDFASLIARAEELYASFEGVQALKARMEELSANIYVSHTYLSNVNKALEEYNALTDKEKDFVGRGLETDLTRTRDDVTAVLTLLGAVSKFDFSKLDNQAILEIAKVYYANPVNSTLLKAEMSEEDYTKLTNLNTYIDYSVLESALTKFEGDDENAWGLSEDEIRSLKTIIDIAEYISSVKFEITFKFLLAGKTLDFDTFSMKILNLYSAL